MTLLKCWWKIQYKANLQADLPLLLQLTGKQERYFTRALKQWHKNELQIGHSDMYRFLFGSKRDILMLLNNVLEAITPCFYSTPILTAGHE